MARDVTLIADSVPSQRKAASSVSVKADDVTVRNLYINALSERTEGSCVSLQKVNADKVVILSSGCSESSIHMSGRVKELVILSHADYNYMNLEEVEGIEEAKIIWSGSGVVRKPFEFISGLRLKHVITPNPKREMKSMDFRKGALGMFLASLRARTYTV